MLRAICFDLDGTLADTERLGHRPAYNKAFKDHGLPWRWSPKLYRTLLRHPGGGRDRLRHYLDTYQSDFDAETLALPDDPNALVQALHQRKAHHFDRIVRRGEVPLRPGVRRIFLEAQEAGVKLAVVSNASRSTVAPMLRHSMGAEMTEALDVVLCGDEGLRKKPAPDLYLEALNRLALSANEAVAVEDSELGLRAALAAGLPVLVTLNHITEGEDFSGAGLVVDSLGDADDPTRLAEPPLLNGSHVTLADLRALLRRRSDSR